MVEKLKFFDVKAKESFLTNRFEVVVRNGRKFAIAKSPLSKTNGKPTNVWRIVRKNFRK